MPITKDQILSSLHTLSIEDIREINQAAYAIAKSYREVEAAMAKRSLRVGMKVSWNGKHGYNIGKILKVNRSRCVIETGTQKWTVPMTMLQEI